MQEAVAGQDVDEGALYPRVPQIRQVVRRRQQSKLLTVLEGDRDQHSLMDLSE